MTTTSRMMRVIRFCSAFGVSALLAACGGGGGGGGGGTTPPATFTVGGTVSGLAAGATVVLQNNTGNNLTVAANGAFTFSPALNSGSAYAVSVLTQPSSPAQTCTVTNGTGSVTGNVTNVTVTCVTRTFTVGGSVSGLTGTGLVIQNNAGNNTTIGANGNFTFAAPVASGANYAVTVLTQPSGPTQVCSVANGSGTIAAANVTNVAITCASNAFTVGGSVSGLVGSGLVLQNNGGNNLAIAGNGPFTFSAGVAGSAAYAATVLAQPSNPAQTCVVTSGSGTIGSANVTNVSVACTTNTYTISGTVSGLNGTGLVLRNNGGNSLAVAGNGAFSFTTPLASGGAYAVTVQTQPSGPLQNCVVGNGSGTVVNANVSNVTVTCANVTYTVSGTITGYSGSGLTLQLNAGNNLTINAGNSSFSFATTPINPGGAYAVSVLTQPSNPTQTCSVTNGSGTITANVTNVTINCTTSSFTVGGTVSGLTGSGLVLRNNGGNNLAVAADGSFSFTTPVASGQAYAVTVFTQPTSPAQTCTIANGSGTIGGANVTNVVVNCSDTTYTIGGTVSGLSGSGLVLRNNGGNNLAISANGSFTFSTALANGAAYAVTVFTSPSSPTQTCSVGNGSGTIAAANVTNVTINCSTSTYTVGGAVTGLGVSTGLVLRISTGGSDITMNADDPFTFTPALPSGTAYAVTVQTPPTGGKVCSVARGVGTVGGANVTNVAVVCSTTTFTVGGTISGLPSGTNVVLQNNGTNNLTVAANGSFTFTTPIASGSDYLVSVFTNPVSPARSCVVTAGSGTASANVTSVVVNCLTKRIFLSNSLGDDGVSVFSVNPTTGALTENAHYTVSPDDAMGVAVTPSGSHVFAAVRLSGLAGLRLRAYVSDSATGALTFSGTDAVVNTGPEVAIGQRKILVAPSGSDVYVLDFPNGGIAHFQFNPGLSSLTNLGLYTVQGMVDIAMTPDSQYMYATSYDFNNIWAYRIQGGGSLAPLNPATVTPFLGTTNSEMYLAIDPQSRFLFVAQQRNSFINAYSINGATGALTFANQVSTVGPGPATLEVHAVATEPTGRFLYAANSDGNIWGYSVNQTSGALTALAGSPFAGSGSTANEVKLTVDSSGKYLYKVSGADGAVSVYSINSTTGAVTAAGSITPANGGITDIALE